MAAKGSVAEIGDGAQILPGEQRKRADACRDHQKSDIARQMGSENKELGRHGLPGFEQLRHA